MTIPVLNRIIAGWIAFGAILFIVLLFIPAPYGRHNRKGWGPSISNRVGWILMELPSLLCFAYFFLRGGTGDYSVAWLFLGLWAAHYIHRSLIYPFRTRTSGKTIPVLIVIFAIFFNLVNGSINGYYLSVSHEKYNSGWLSDPRFILGLLLFFAGAVINFFSDRHLLRLRKSRTNGYSIPRGGLFKLVSCPNFFGEVLEWTGFAVMVWNPAGLAFALWTFFNLVPRALDHHRWYQSHFKDYPEQRKAIIPFIL